MKTKPDSKKTAVKLLEYADNTERKLREKLARRGYTAAECDEAIEYVRGIGALNDARLMERTVERLATVKLYGRRRIASELYVKGFRRADIEEFDFSEYDFPALCALRIRRTAARYPERDKMYASLLRYGYTSGDISAAYDIVKNDG